MADFVAVLRKTLDGMGETTPATRQRVYEKARSTVAAKLAAINPPPPPSVADRQRRALEDAIGSIEREYAANSDPLSELEDVFASLKNPQPKALEQPAVKTGGCSNALGCGFFSEANTSSSSDSGSEFAAYSFSIDAMASSRARF